MHNEMQLLEQRRGSVGRWQQKEQRGRGVNIALYTLEDSSIPEQGEGCFQRIASADNNLQIIRSETFFPKMKNCQSDTCKTKLTLENVGQQKQKAKDYRAGQVSGRKSQQPAAMRQ
jgi:hypothetical protein